VPGGQPYTGQGYTGQPAPGNQPYTGQPYPGQPGPGNQPYPGQPYPGQPYPGNQPPGTWADPNQPGFAAVNLPGQSLSNVARQRGIRMVVTGLIVLVVGIAISVISYNLASNGGTYFISLLPIAGVVRIIMGLKAIARANKLPR
jgi:hypothetical protein